MLPQPLLIFRKDLQHLWPETLVVLALFVAFCFTAPSAWAAGDFAVYVPIISAFIKILMPVAWLVVIARLVQDEPLVGDRQFWTSRPYHWAQLLAAKVLYLLVFLYLPFFLMQVYLLKHAGLHPLLALGGLFHNLLLLTVIIVVPFMAISAVTSTFVRMLLTTLAVLVTLAVLFGVGFALTFLNMSPPHLDWIANTIFILVPLAALIYQYRTRRTGIARILLLLTPVIAILIYVLAPTNSMIAHAYPADTAADAPKVTSLTGQDATPPASAGPLNLLRHHVILGLPVRVEGIDEKNDYRVVGTRVTLTGPNVHYTSSFNSSAFFGADLNAGSRQAFLAFYLPEKIFNQVRNTATDVHLELATQHLAAQDPSTWKADANRFSVPGNGVCTFPSGDETSQTPTCRYAFAPPDISFVTAKLSPAGCPAGGASGLQVPGRASIGGPPSALAFDPVVSIPLSFRTGDPNQTHTYALCPGTDLQFVQGKELANTSLSVDAKNLVLDPYASRRTVPGSAPVITPGPTPE